MDSRIIVEQDEQGSLFTTSEAIAEGAGIRHKNVLEAVAKYRDQLEEFGLVAFETRARLAGQHGGGERRVALLNEQQATLILTLARNTPEVVAFKVTLVKEFTRMAQELQSAEEPSLEELTLKVIEGQKARIAELEPKASAWDDVVGATGSMSFRDAAKTLHDHDVIRIGGNKLIEKCIEWGWLYRPQTGDKDKTPAPRAKQPKLDQGVFVEKATTYTDRWTGEKKISSAPQVRVTGKGLDSIRKRLMEEKAGEAA